jgi:protein deglycase
MPTAAVLLAPGFEEIEAVTIIDVLRRAGVEVRILGQDAGRVRGAHDVVMEVDQLFSDAWEDWDVVVLPGGMPGATNLRDDERVMGLVRRQIEADRKVAAICAAPIALAAAGVLDGVQATCYPGFEDQLGDAEHTTTRVVIDGNVTTSRGPGTALWFALSLVAQLCGGDKSDELRKAMLVQ